jgi:osmotically-inducible protein OsmY
MSDGPTISQSLKAALASEPAVDLRSDRIDLEFEDGVATVSGEVSDIAAKLCTLRLAAGLPGVEEVVDRLRTKPPVPMDDDEIAHFLQHQLLSEPLLEDCALHCRYQDERRSIRELPEDKSTWHVDVQIADGVVSLAGTVPSLKLKRLIGSFAWWVPGSRDVTNELRVEPPEEDSDDKILEALALILDRDRLADMSLIDASCADRVITLRGTVVNDAQRELVEFDAWTLFGVERVVDEL